MEVKSEEGSVLNRKCVVVRWKELTLEKFLDLTKRGAGALLVLLPSNWEEVEEAVAREWMELETELLAMDIAIPVYLAPEDEELREVYLQTTRLAKREKNSSVAASKDGGKDRRNLSSYYILHSSSGFHGD